MTYAAEVAADSPIAYWRLDDTSGTNALDTSGNSHTGTYTAGPVLNQSSLIIGSNPAVSFDGTDDFIDLTNNAAFRVSTAWTLEAWVKVTGGDTIMGTAICAAYDGTSVRFALDCFDGAGHTLKPSVGFYNGSWHIAQSATPISAGSVYHLVGTWDGTVLTIYVNGSSVATNTPGVSVPTSSTSTHYIARRWDSSGDGRFFHGIMDEVAIYGTDIGATRIAAHYTAGTVNPDGTALPAAVAGIGSVPGPTTSGTAKAAPTTTVGTGAVPAPTVTGTAFATPSTAAGIGAIPAPTGSAAALASPSTTVGLGAVPVPAAFGGGQGVATPNATAAVGAVPAPTLSGIALALPAVASGVGAVPASTTTGLAIALPTQVAGTGVVPGPFVGGVENATALPDNVIAIGRVPRARGEGQGTGGGGGSINGVTDYWAIKALG